MYPEILFLGLGFYEIFTFLGIVCCFLVFRFYITEKHMSAKVFNFYLIVSVISIVIGYFFASLFQSIFTFIKTGKFSLFESGITFYGGLFGGILTFLFITFVLGKIFVDKTQLLSGLKIVLQVAPICVSIAHAFGRIGCLFAGCCHGAVSTNFGIRMWVSELDGYYKCVPLQLFEAIFLFVLFAILTIMFFKNKHYEVETYCISYGIWRFVIEFFRADDRGELIKKAITPSQGFAIIFILLGISLIIYRIYNLKHKKDENIIE